MLVDVNVPLRIGDRDAFFVETFLDLFRQIEMSRPVIRGIHPGSDDEIDAVIAEFVDRDRRFGVVENPVISTA